VEQNRKHRNKPMHIWSINVTKEPRIYNGERAVFSINGVGKAEQSYAKE